MDNKYRVPALEKANEALKRIAGEPYRYRLIDLSDKLGLNKSSLYSLLLTMEALGWVAKDGSGKYGIGPSLAALGGGYQLGHDLTKAFQREARPSKERLGETIQLAKLYGSNVLYLAKEEAPSPVRLVSEPGMTFPAHATALGKAMLAQLSDSELESLYPADELEAVTPNTLTSREALFAELRTIRQRGYAEDLEEAVMGFRCVAAPVRGSRTGELAAVSCSMPLHAWESKKSEVASEIRALALRLSS